MDYIVTTDVGTTSIKTTLFDERLSPLASASGEYKIITKADGYVELSPEIYWDYFCRGLKAVCEKADIPTKRITRLAFTT